MNRYLAVLLLGMVIAGCGKSNSPTEPSSTNTSVLIPLSTGNKWIYRTTYTDIDGQVLSTTIDSSYIGLSVYVNGLKYYFYNTQGSDTQSDIRLFRNTSEGVIQLDEHSQTEVLEFKYPAKAGEIYTISSNEFSSFSVNMEVVSIDTEITTQKGTFMCYEYRPSASERINSISDIFIAPNVGIVREVEANAPFDNGGSPDPLFGVTKERMLIDAEIR
ncbi:MAG TPA: hypothetical protein VFO76_04050 [Candidatus Kapabacteria bacterium]|nr:hypothetical protein [Candidatus Kapabacteria bacterium]